MKKSKESKVEKDANKSSNQSQEALKSKLKLSLVDRNLINELLEEKQVGCSNHDSNKANVAIEEENQDDQDKAYRKVSNEAHIDKSSDNAENAHSKINEDKADS